MTYITINTKIVGIRHGIKLTHFEFYFRVHYHDFDAFKRYNGFFSTEYDIHT